MGTSEQQIIQVADHGFDVVHVCFGGPYNDGDIDFSTLDSVITRIVDKNKDQKILLHLMPHFKNDEGISDQLNDGQVIHSDWTTYPNAVIIDVFDPSQREKFFRWIECAVSRYGNDERIAGFVIAWGYYGEHGLYIGNYIADHAKLGSQASGYSDYALSEYNSWREHRQMPLLAQLPLPSLEKQSNDYIQFHHFRSEYLRDVFQTGFVTSAKKHTNLPVGVYGYHSASVDSYARNWTNTPNADFYRTAFATSSFNMSRTLVESGRGVEDAGIHDGVVEQTAAYLQLNAARQIARGAGIIAMYLQEFNTETWEPDTYVKLTRWLREQRLPEQIQHTPPSIALYQPTWGISALPAAGEDRIFAPRWDYAIHLAKMIGLIESFGLPYQLISECNLNDPSTLKDYEHIILPMWDYLAYVLDDRSYEILESDERVIKIPMRNQPIPRSEFRSILEGARVKILMDYDADKNLCGRYGNLLFNWHNEPVEVRIPERADPIILLKHQYLVITDE